MHASFSTAILCCALAPLLLLVTLCPPAAPSPVGLSSPTPCCFRHSAEIPRRYVASYYETSSQCSLPSVIFTTHKGRPICANPAETWVQDYMKSLQQAEEQPNRSRRDLSLQQLLK